MASAFLEPAGRPPVDFSSPMGEPALVPADSVAWQVFRNPVSLFVGGVAAVLLELAEPRVRAGVWDKSSFRREPVERLRRTGLAAMVTVYAARSSAERMIAGVRTVHDGIEGLTPAGEPYRANDPELLDWVQATACFGFLEAYCAFVRPLGRGERDRFYAEGIAAARLYGALGAPACEAEMEAQLHAMRPRLEAAPVLTEFLTIMGRAPILPPPLRPLQRLMIRGAADILPGWLRDKARLSRLTRSERGLLSALAPAAGSIRLDRSPPAQASVRLGLEPDYLWKAAATSASIRSSSPS